MENFYIFLLLAAGSALPCLAGSPKTSLLYPYGKAQGDSENPIADDGNSPEISIETPFSFYGKKYNSLYVNNNGVISFGKYVSEYTPNAFPLKNGIPFVAPFWADVDNRVSGNIFWRQTKDPVLLSWFAADLSRYNPDNSFTPTWMFIATWDKVSYFGSASDKVNIFQAVLCTDEGISFIMLNYADIQWTTGTGNNGDIHTGLGGIPAQAGFDSGDQENYYNIPGSRTSKILNITETSNVGAQGRWMFQVDTSITGVPTAKSETASDADTIRFSRPAWDKFDSICQSFSNPSATLFKGGSFLALPVTVDLAINDCTHIAGVSIVEGRKEIHDCYMCDE